MSEHVPEGFDARPAKSQDIEQMCLVKMRAYAGQSGEELPTTVPEDYEYLAEISKRQGYEDQWSHLMLDDERVAGFALGYAGNWRGEVTPGKNEQYLWLLMIDPDYQRRGLGQCLVRMAANTTRELGAENLSLYVPLDHEPAKALYEAEGFEPEGAIISPTEGALINYKLSLNPGA